MQDLDGRWARIWSERLAGNPPWQESFVHHPSFAVFWQSLASFSEGLGIILVDVLRNEGIEGPYRVVGKLADMDIRLLKSRLSLSQER